MRQARKKADAAGIYRYSYPKRLGGFAHRTSNTPAAPMPPPMHIVTTT